MNKPLAICLTIATAAVLAAATWTTVTAQPAGGAAPAATKVAVCDIVDVFNNYNRARDESTKLENRKKWIDAESKKREKKIESEMVVLEQGFRPGTPAYEKQRDKVQQLMVEQKVWVEVQRGQALQDHFNLTREMYEEIVALIAKVARQNGYDLVLYREEKKIAAQNTAELLRAIGARKVLYNSDNIDITKEVLDKLNTQYEASKAKKSNG